MTDSIILPTRRFQATADEARAGSDETFWITSATLQAMITNAVSSMRPRLIAEALPIDTIGQATFAIPAHLSTDAVVVALNGRVATPGGDFTIGGGVLTWLAGTAALLTELGDTLMTETGAPLLAEAPLRPSDILIIHYIAMFFVAWLLTETGDRLVTEDGAGLTLE